MILINTLILAISSSIDSFGIGITYGLKKIKLSDLSKLILFLISIIVTSISVVFGIFLKNSLSSNFIDIFGSLFFICMGIFIILKTNKQEYSFDFDDSKNIDSKEALILGLALSLDSFCIGIGASSININIYIFSFLVAILQFLFLSLGNFFGINLANLKLIPQSIWTKISGILLILIGLFKI